jgi:hypothetical protein
VNAEESSQYECGRGVGYREALADVADLLAEQGLGEWAERLRAAQQVHFEEGTPLLEQAPWS